MYEVYKKGSPVKIGESNETNPILAALDSLKYQFAVGIGTELTQDSIDLKEMGGDYEYTLNGETYILKKVDKPVPQDQDTA